MARQKKSDEELESEASRESEEVLESRGTFMLCPPKRGYETPERRSVREACEKAAAARRLDLARMTDTKPELFTPEGYRYSSGSFVGAVKGALSSQERREYGCIEVGYTPAQREAFGCARDSRGKFTGVLKDGTNDRRCKQDKKFSGQRKKGSKTFSDSMCASDFKGPCMGDRFGRAGEQSCPVQFVTVGGRTGLRLCSGQNKPGELVAAEGPAAVEALAAKACAYWSKNKTWQGFEPEVAKGFGRATRKSPKATKSRKRKGN